jgi:hypothetical protein
MTIRSIKRKNMLYCGNTFLAPLPPYGLKNNHITYSLPIIFMIQEIQCVVTTSWRLSRSGRRCDKPFDAVFSANESAHDVQVGTSIKMLRNFKKLRTKIFWIPKIFSFCSEFHRLARFRRTRASIVICPISMVYAPT